MRVVLNSYHAMPQDVSYWIDDSNSYDQFGHYTPRPKTEQIAAWKALLAKNEEIIRSKTLAWWLESEEFVKFDRHGRIAAALDLGDCRHVHAPTVETAYGLTRIASLDLDQGSLTENLLLSNVETVYASQASLYLSTPYYWWDAQSRDTDFTYIHKIDMTNIHSGGVRCSPEWWFSVATVQRSIFADDYVYAIADFGVQSARLDALQTPVSKVAYQCDESCYSMWWYD